MSTAGIIVIGNEVLSGKVEEQNARFLIRELREIGVELQRIVIIRDDVDAIAEEVRKMSAALQYVFTSGGVGSTHDDCTMEGVAKGLGVPIVRHAELDALLRKRWGRRATEAALRMADVPKGTTLISDPQLFVPIVVVKNVYVLPGVPEFLRRKFGVLKTKLAGGKPFVLRQIFVNVGESEIADLMRGVQNAHREIEIGSYPRFDTDEYRVKITIEGRDPQKVGTAFDALMAALDRSWIVRTEVL